jgi:hypothetical protein
MRARRGGVAGQKREAKRTEVGLQLEEVPMRLQMTKKSPMLTLLMMLLLLLLLLLLLPRMILKFGGGSLS